MLWDQSRGGVQSPGGCRSCSRTLAIPPTSKRCTMVHICTPKFPFQVDQFLGRDCKYLAVANGITSGEKLQYTIYNTVQPPPHIEWDLVFFVLCMIGCANLCYTCLCARVRVLLRQFVLCVIDTVARKVTRKPCSFAILITRTVIIIKYCSILYSMRFKGYVLNSHFIFQHPEYVCL